MVRSLLLLRPRPHKIIFTITEKDNRKLQRFSLFWMYTQCQIGRRKYFRTAPQAWKHSKNYTKNSCLHSYFLSLTLSCFSLLEIQKWLPITFFIFLLLLSASVYEFMTSDGKSVSPGVQRSKPRPNRSPVAIQIAVWVQDSLDRPSSSIHAENRAWIRLIHVYHATTPLGRPICDQRSRSHQKPY